MRVLAVDEMYAHRKPGGGFDHFYRATVALTSVCGVPADEVAVVRLIPDANGTHWCWKDANGGRYSMVWPSLQHLSMCFPDGVEGAEARGVGERARVRIEVVEFPCVSS